MEVGLYNGRPHDALMVDGARITALVTVDGEFGLQASGSGLLICLPNMNATQCRRLSDIIAACAAHLESLDEVAHD